LLEGGERHEAFDYPDEHWYYFQMADRFGWTPEVVDNLPAGTADWIMAIARTIDEVKADRSG
tara:strand:- start:3472 stop:3657 length:186 start_codon:yes stop_codon:yes gene_type:complete